MSEKTMFPREDHADILFQKILNDPWACDRLMETFNENLVYNDEFDVSLPAEKFAKALFNAYTNRDLSALLMCGKIAVGICIEESFSKFFCRK